ncbi:MAG: Crp/Fnr family transcriptional regulator [Bacteroidota bacterium]
MNSIVDRIKTSCTVGKTNCNCFDHLTDEQNELVKQNQVMVVYRKGEIIAKQGTFTTHILYICEGLAKVYYEDNNKSLILRIASPGSLIGLTSLPLSQNVFQYTASAYVETRVKLIDINVIRKLILENGKFASAIIDVLCEISIQKNGRFFCLTHRQSYGKLADILLCLAGNIFNTDKFDLSLSRKELAELSGMSTESVIRTLKHFQDDGLIKITGKTFEVIDPDGLMRICQLG